MRILLSLTSSLLALSAASGTAAEEASSVDEVIVTAARLPTTPADAPGVRVVDREAIETLQATFVADVLSLVPGLSLYSEGAFGGQTSVRMRGASADKTLVLIDGMPVNDPSSPSGAYDFASMSLGDVDRIEILSGPQSSLWGSSAIGGVVAFTTRELDGIVSEAEAGSFGTVRGQVAIGAANGSRAASVFLSGFRSRGISKADENDGNVEADGFETWTGGLAGRIRISPSVELDGRLRHTDSRIELDGFPPPFFLLADTADRSESRAWTGHGRARIDGPGGVRHVVSFSAHDIERESFGGFASVFTADRRVYRWVAERDRPDDSWGFTGGVEHEAVRGDASFAEAELATTSVFGVARFSPTDRATLTLGVRRDDPDGFDGETTVRASAAAEFGAGFRASAAFGQGFKTPTISQILCDFCFAPAVPLDPETAQGWDITFGWRSADRRVAASATAYHLEVVDQIAYVAGRYENISRTSADGIELDLAAELGGGYRLKAGYAYTDATDRSTGLRLLRTPQHAGSASISWTGARAGAAFTVRAESEQMDVDGFGTGVRDGFVTADLAGRMALNARVELTARVENLFDAEYQEVLGYGEPGLSGYVGVRLRY